MIISFHADSDAFSSHVGLSLRFVKSVLALSYARLTRYNRNELAEGST